MLQAETFAIEEWICYPSPANDRVTIAKGSEKIKSVAVCDFTGKKVSDEKMTNVSTAAINVRTLPAGIYLLEVTTGQSHTLSKKIMIK